MFSFHLKESGTSWSREILAGIVTFVTMSYIICVQPAVLSGAMFGLDTGLDAGPLLTTTCLASAAGSILMGIWSRYPLALAPGMGENFFVVLTLLPAASAVNGGLGSGPAFRLALGVVFFAGVLFFLLSLLRVREFLFDQVSPSLKGAIGVGLGLFIAYLGLKNAGIIRIAEGQLQTGSLVSKQAQIFFIGLAVTFIFLARNKPWGILIGMIASGTAAFFFGELKWNGFVGLPSNPVSVIGQIDFTGVVHHISQLWPYLLILLFMDMFDTFGTVIGAAAQGNLMKGGTLPRMERVFMADATATVAGALLGHSTVTAYLESASGIAVGGRTGLVSVVTGICFLAALFFSPLILAVVSCSAVTAPALVVVGVMMTTQVKTIRWDDWTESFPAFWAIAGIPFTGSIATGIMTALIFYPFGKLLGGRLRETSIGGWILALVLLGYVLFVKI